MLGIKIWPLNLLRTLLSMPLGFRQFRLILTYRSDWCRMNFLVLFLTILGFTRGLRAAMVPLKETGTLKHRSAQKRGFPCPGLQHCCRVPSNHQLPSKQGMEWVSLPGLFFLPSPKLAEYEPFARRGPGRLGVTSPTPSQEGIPMADLKQTGPQMFSAGKGAANPTPQCPNPQPVQFPFSYAGI